MKTILIAAALAVVAAPCAAQQAMTVGGAPTGTVLKMGTDVPLKTRTELTTQGKKLKPGDRFDLEVSEAVMLNGQTVIPVGARAVGEVTAIRNKGMWGKSGNIDARVLYVIANDRQIRLAGTLADKGKAGGVGAVAVSAIVFAPAGFFMTGTSARIPAGTQMVGRLDEDVPIVFAGSTAPAPMAVPAEPLIKSYAPPAPKAAPPATAQQTVLQH